MFCSPPPLGGTNPGVSPPTWVQPSKWTSGPLCAPDALFHFSATHHRSRWTAANLPLIFDSAMRCIHVSLTPGYVLIEPSTAAFRHTKGLIELLHLAYLLLPCDVTLDKTVRHRIHIGRSRGRNAVDCKCTRRQRQINTHLVFPRHPHFGHTFLSAVTTTPRHQPRSPSHMSRRLVDRKALWL